jgi:hypothetical protein
MNQGGYKLTHLGINGSTFIFTKSRILFEDLSRTDEKTIPMPLPINSILRQGCHETGVFERNIK